MKLLFDARYIRPDHLDGISRFSIGLARAIAERVNVEFLISDPRQRDYLPERPCHEIWAPTSWREPFCALAINRLAPDIVFTPMQTMGSLGKRFRLVLTVHDLIYYQHRTPPRDLPWPIRLLWRGYHLFWWPQRVLLSRADGVVVVSETTRRLVEQHRLAQAPLYTVGNAADRLDTDNTTSRVPTRQLPDRTKPVDENYLYMGTFMPYKNVETLVAGIARRPGARLHLLSKCSPADQNRLRALPGGQQLVFHNGVTDAQYVQLLDQATALVSASRQEGFGIPLIEAGSRGTPLIVSEIEIFREVAGNAALFFDPDNPDAFAHQAEQLCHKDIWREFSRLSRANAARYSWAISAQQLENALRTVLSTHRVARTGMLVET